MGSINPVFVTPAAAARRANEIAGGFADSFTLGCGQFCTKPGLVVVPESFDRQLLLDALANRSGGRLLTAGIAEAYARGLEQDRRCRIARGRDPRRPGVHAVACA
jgi:NADP-dependent aldehyde dehydrogenase